MSVYSVLDFGAVNTGSADTTPALQKAIDACYLAGGGEVQLPAGAYLAGDITLRSGVTLHLLSGAILLGSRNPEDYYHYRQLELNPLAPEDISDEPYPDWSDPAILAQDRYIPNDPTFRYSFIYGTRWNNALIRAFHAENIAIIGDKGSVIDGGNCFDSIGEEKYRGPHGMSLWDCRNILLKGYTIQNTGNWAHSLVSCEDITARKLTVYAGHDGIDSFMGKNLHITDCVFHTGDDSIAGYGNEQVLVEESLLNSSCSAFRFAGSDVLIRKCKMVGPGLYAFRGALTPEEKASSAPSPIMAGRNNMLSAFTHYADYKYPLGWRANRTVIEDCDFVNADRFLHYNYNMPGENWQKGTPLEDITFRRVHATGVAMPLHLHGSPEQPIRLVMEDVDISLRDCSSVDTLLEGYGFSEILLRHVKVATDKPQKIKLWSEGPVVVENCIGISSEPEMSREEYISGAI